MMQVIAQSNNLQAELLEFLYGKIKQSAVIRFKAQVTALAQQLLVQCQEVAVRQTAFGMTNLRPGVAEIQIQLLDFAGLKPVQQVFGISTNDFNIRQLFVLRCLSGEIGNIMLCFNANKGLIRIQLCHTDGKTSLAAADFQTQTFAREHFLPMSLELIDIMQKHVFSLHFLHCFFNPWFFS